jgi:hypothetical protein
MYIHSIEIVVIEHLTIKKDYGNESACCSGISFARPTQLAQTPFVVAAFVSVPIQELAERSFETPQIRSHNQSLHD